VVERRSGFATDAPIASAAQRAAAKAGTQRFQLRQNQNRSFHGVTKMMNLHDSQ
jgi:hypothetical protein